MFLDFKVSPFVDCGGSHPTRLRIKLAKRAILSSKLKVNTRPKIYRSGLALSMESLITVSTVNNINYAFSDEESQRNKAMDKLTGRRSRKALKGGEKRWVWPPELEAAFLEGDSGPI